MNQPAHLFIFSGLPATGKTTLAQGISRLWKIPHIRIDTLEQGLRDACGLSVAGEGYDLAYRIAADNLMLGLSVLSDSCNPILLTRRAWQQVAIDAGVPFTNIEVLCSDKDVHRARAEQRTSSIAGLTLPTWQQIADREFDPWDSNRIVIDTAQETPEASVLRLEHLLVQQLSG